MSGNTSGSLFRRWFSWAGRGAPTAVDAPGAPRLVSIRSPEADPFAVYVRRFASLPVPRCELLPQLRPWKGRGRRTGLGGTPEAGPSGPLGRASGVGS